jgi:4-oxalocrotonate tautomerase
MPLIEVKMIDKTFTASEKREIVSKLTDALVSVKDEYIRKVTWVLVTIQDQQSRSTSRFIL